MGFPKQCVQIQRGGERLHEIKHGESVFDGIARKGKGMAREQGRRWSGTEFTGGCRFGSQMDVARMSASSDPRLNFCAPAGASVSGVAFAVRGADMSSCGVSIAMWSSTSRHSPAEPVHGRFKRIENFECIELGFTGNGSGRTRGTARAMIIPVRCFTCGKVRMLPPCVSFRRVSRTLQLAPKRCACCSCRSSATNGTSF